MLVYGDPLFKLQESPPEKRKGRGKKNKGRGRGIGKGGSVGGFSFGDVGGGGGGGGGVTYPAPTFVGSTFGFQSTNGADLSLAMPVDIEDGDFIWMGISDFYEATNYDPGGDWEFIGTSDSQDYTRLSVYGRFLGAAEADPVVIPAARLITCGHIGVVRGVDPLTPVGDVIQVAEGISGDPGLLPAPTTTEDNSMVILVGSIRKYLSSATTTNADLTGLTDEGGITAASNQQTTHFMAYGVKETAGAVGDFSCDYTNGGDLSFHVAFELKAGVDPFAGASHRWDASDESSITDSSGTVTTIVDKAGSLDLDTNFGTTPTTGTITQNGRNTINFDHGDRLETTGSLATATGDLTVVACIEVDDVTPLLGTGYLFANDLGSDQIRVWLNASARINVFVAGATGLNGPVQSNGFIYVALTIDTVGDEALLYVNDFSTPAMTLSGLGSLTSWDAGWAFMNRPSAGADHLDGQFCEGAIWNEVLSASDLAALETYINAKWVPAAP